MKTNLTHITLTGADDSVHPAGLLRLSEEYPLVEWGILIGSRQVLEQVYAIL